MNATADSMPMEPSDQDVLAAEYVLGVLDATARRDVERRIGSDAPLAREISLWETRFVPLLADVAPVPAPYALWPRIRAAVGLDIDAARAPTTVSTRPGLWQNTQFWRWLSAGAGIVAAASVAALLLLPPQIIRVPAPTPVAQAPAPPPAPTPPPVQAPAEPPVVPLVAKLTEGSGKALFLATLDTRHGTIVIQPTSVKLPKGRVPELWVIPPGGVPHSLGLLDTAKAEVVSVPADLRDMLASHALVAVSVEPPGGAPAGKPTGPIIAKGEISLL